MKKKLVGITLVLAMVMSCLFAFTACNKPENPEQITFVLDWTPNTNHTGLYVAQHKGYFAEEGLSVKFIQPGTEGASMNVSAGNGQFGIDFQEQMLWHEQNGVKVTALGAVVQHNTSGLVSLAKDNIKRPKDLEGKKYASWGLPGEQAIVNHMIAADGGDPTKLVMEVKTVEDIIKEFNDKNGVDCVWSFKAWDYQKLLLTNDEKDLNFINMREYDGLDYYTPVIIGNNDYIANHPDYVKKFMRAVAKGYKYAIEHPREAAEMLIAENPDLNVNEQLIYKSQAFLSPEYQSDAQYWGHIDATRWNKFNALMHSIDGETFPEITKNFGFTNEFLPDYTEA